MSITNGMSKDRRERLWGLVGGMYPKGAVRDSSVVWTGFSQTKCGRMKRTFIQKSKRKEQETFGGLVE